MTRVSIDLVIAQANTLLNYIKKNTIPYTADGMSLTGMDCQGLVEYCFIQADVPKSEMDLAGSNAHFRAMRYTCTPEKAKELFGETPAGATLFILAQDGGEPDKYKADGVGNASHMGLWTGKTSIAASASKGKAIESNFKGKTINGGWNMVGFDKHAIYSDKVEAILAGLVGTAAETETDAGGEEAAETPVTASVFSTKYSRYRWQSGDKGSGVRAVQAALNRAGSDPQLDIDGDFGPATKAAVVAFQTAHGLDADGVVGEYTWTALINAVNAA